MCFVHPSTVPQCAVYKSAGVTLSWSSNDWSPSINGTRACGDIDLFWSEQTAPRDFLCHILGLDPDLPLKVEYVQLWLWWSAWVATIIHLAVLMIATRDVSMTCVWLGDYKIGARSIDRLVGTLIRECKMGKRERGEVGKVLSQLLHSHCSSQCEAEVRSELRPLWLWATGKRVLGCQATKSGGGCLFPAAHNQSGCSQPLNVSRVPVTFLSKYWGSFENVFIKSGAKIVSSNPRTTRLTTLYLLFVKRNTSIVLKVV